MAEIKHAGAVVIEFSRAEFELVKKALEAAYTNDLLAEYDNAMHGLISDLCEVA